MYLREFGKSSVNYDIDAWLDGVPDDERPETMKPAEVDSSVGVGRYRDSEVCFLRPGPDVGHYYPN